MKMSKKNSSKLNYLCVLIFNNKSVNKLCHLIINKKFNQKRRIAEMKGK